MLALRERRMRVTKAVRARRAAVECADAGQDFDAARESTLYRKKVCCLALVPADPSQSELPEGLYL